MNGRQFIAVAASTFSLIGISAAQYPKDGIRLCKQIDLPQFQSNPDRGSGCSGYVSPSGREYVVMGIGNGTSVVEVTNPNSATEIGFISGPQSTWHESVVAGQYAYCVTEAGGGMQIINLGSADAGIVTLAGTYTGLGLNTVHTIETNSHYLYLNGSNRGFVILDIANPTAPVEVARWTNQYVHDSTIVTHTSGPNAGKEIAYLCCGGAGVTVLDITNKSNLATMGSFSYVANGYCHSGSLSPDYRYYYVNDEFDEGNGVVTDCTTHIIDVSNPAAMTEVAAFLNPIGVIDHNSVLKGGFLNLAAYRGGLRVYNASNPTALSESGYFDTYPAGQGFNYSGAWGTFVFPSGTTAIADINRGLFVVDPSEARNQGAPLLDTTYLSGSLSSGTLKSMKFADGQALEARWSESANPLDPAVVEFVVGCETTRAPAAFLDLTLKSKLSGLAFGSCTVSLKNWTSGQFVTIGQIRQSWLYGTSQMNNLQGAAYVDGTGRIEVKLKFEPKGSGDVPTFGAVVDQLKVSVRKS